MFQELAVGHGLLEVVGEEEVAGFHDDDGVDACVVGDAFAHAAHVAHGGVHDLPVEAFVGEGVVGDALGREVGDEFLVLKLVELEVVACLRGAVEVFDEGYDAGVHLQLHVVGIGGVLLVATALVLVLEVQPFHRPAGDDLGAQVEGEQGYEGGTDHVGAHEAGQTDASTDHGYDFAVAGQFGGEEDDGDEDEEGGEEVGVVGHEVEVIDQQLVPWCAVLGELVDVVVIVKDNGHPEDEQDGEEIGTQELRDDVGVYSLEEWETEFQRILGLGNRE